MRGLCFRPHAIRDAYIEAGAHIQLTQQSSNFSIALFCRVTSAPQLRNASRKPISKCSGQVRQEATCSMIVRSERCFKPVLASLCRLVFSTAAAQDFTRAILQRQSQNAAGGNGQAEVLAALGLCLRGGRTIHVPVRQLGGPCRYTRRQR